MTNKINDGGAAFPRPAVRQQTVEGIYCDSPQDGMTLRDYFAAQVLPEIYKEAMNSHVPFNRKFIAQDAYLMAEAMIRAREEQP